MPCAREESDRRQGRWSSKLLSPPTSPGKITWHGCPGSPTAAPNPRTARQIDAGQRGSPDRDHNELGQNDKEELKWAAREVANARSENSAAKHPTGNETKQEATHRRRANRRYSANQQRDHMICALALISQSSALASPRRCALPCDNVPARFAYRSSPAARSRGQPLLARCRDAGDAWIPDSRVQRAVGMCPVSQPYIRQSARVSCCQRKISVPSTRASPEVGLTKPSNRRMVVVSAAPLRPRKRDRTLGDAGKIPG